MVDGVFVHPRAVGHHLFDVAFYRTQKPRRRSARTVARIVGKDAAQISVQIRRPLEFVLPLLTTVMFAQRDTNLRQRLDFSARAILWPGAGDFAHHFLDVFELAQSRPAAITAPPIRAWL